MFVEIYDENMFIFLLYLNNYNKWFCWYKLWLFYCILLKFIWYKFNFLRLFDKILVVVN